MYGNQPAADCPTNPSPIASAISRIDEGQYQLDQAIERLAGRLAAVTAPIPPEGKGGSTVTPVATCPLEDQLRRVGDRSLAHAAALFAILDRIQL